MRDLKADLELCNKATPGPWVYGDTNHGYYLSMPYRGGLAMILKQHKRPRVSDMRLIAESREGWPEAIERAVKAEALTQELAAVLGRALVNWGVICHCDGYSECESCYNQKELRRTLAKVKKEVE